jgi:OmpA-OmpF porin, OOP family
MKVWKVLPVLVTLLPLFGHAASDTGFSVDGSFGRGGRDFGPTTNVVDLNVGYRWSWFGVEAGYVDFKRTNTEAFLDAMPLSYGFKEKGFTTGVSGHWDIISNWYLSARTGAFFWREAFYTSPIGKKSSAARGDGTSWYAGVGAGYDFTKNFSLGMSYDWYDADEDMVHVPSVKAEIRF